MKTLDELYSDLEKYKDFDDDESAENFLNTADAIALKKDRRSISVLLKYFSDRDEYSWIISSLTKVIEYYDMKEYIEESMRNIQELLIKAPFCAENIFNRIFNNNHYRKYMMENLHLAPKESLLKLFDLMDEESPHHRELIASLREKLKKS